LGTASLSYSQDYDEAFSPNSYTYDFSHMWTWADTQMPYMKNTQILQCPENPKALDIAAFFAIFGMLPAGNIRYTSYMGNFAVFEDGKNTGPPPMSINPTGDSVVSQAEIEYPSESTLWYDATILGPPSFYSPSVPRHNDGANANFCDGHAKWMKFDHVTTFTDLLAGTTQGGMVAGGGPYCFEGPGDPKDYPGDFPDELWGVVYRSGANQWVDGLH
jgi:prepilin-type processing-associated H-X9-DG protein